MKTIKLVAMIMIFSSLALSACKKTETEAPVTTKKDYLTAKDWMLTAASITTASGSNDIYGPMNACLKDDLTRYATDYTQIHKPGLVKCDPSEPASAIIGTWALAEGDTKLLLITGSDTTTMTVKTLTSAALITTVPDNSSGTTQTITFTYTAQ